MYDTATGTWSTAALSQPRSELSATSAGGKVFFVGGFASTYSDRVDIYDTVTDTWTTSTLSQPRRSLKATSIGSKVFFGGGIIGGGVRSNVVDIYDTATGIWTTAALSLARYDLSATSAGGKVFFAGGDASTGYTNRVDIYDLMLRHLLSDWFNFDYAYDTRPLHRLSVEQLWPNHRYGLIPPNRWSRRS
ncbi:hypothetical protein IC229_00730 [Spirosoma sp. BT702]|uniref:Kelch repeat-containing protein n=1 Tax=Spirosoma profusum TaxID=2771354 RepID=A0A926XT56_9BACT|nr:hypothetical protein [Spirosoma profusum]